MDTHVQHILGPNQILSKDLSIIKKFNMTEDPIKEILGGPKCLEQVMVEKTNNNDCVVSAVAPRVSETQLTAATGGAELSCYRCTIPFGVVILIAGVVVTAVAYSFNSHGSIISVFGLVLLSSGLLLVCSSAFCWKIRQRKKRAKRRESQTALVANQRSLFA
ncbi:transmembrane protein 100 isoform X2 [Lissotriton helveticus]